MGQSAGWDTTRMKTVFAVLIIGLLAFFCGRHVSTAEDGAPNEQPSINSPMDRGLSAQEPE